MSKAIGTHRKRRAHSLALQAITAMCAVVAAASALAHDDGSVEEILVVGRAESQIGESVSASQGFVGYDDIRLPPLLRVGELVEAVPGMVATQHSGTGKANQYFLRGFNLDHGTDFSASLNGVPINFRTHGHGQGYLDLNFFIPELVETTQYTKGPYHADVGDFSSAGHAAFRYADSLDAPQVTLSAGEFGHRRGLAAGTLNLGHDTLTAALDVTRYSGPWDLDEDAETEKAYLSYAGHVGEMDARLSFLSYQGSWRSTDQVPRRLIEQGAISRLGFVDPDLGGETRRNDLIAELRGANSSLVAYVTDYDFELYSNFTYFLDNPENGDEFEQVDRRTRFGVNYRSAYELDQGRLLSWGVDLQHDDIREVGLHSTRSRERLATVRSDRVDESSAAAWLKAEVPLGDRVRVQPGVRVDHYRWDVTAQRAENSGDGQDTLVSPSLSAAWRVGESAELYANWGRGFHSNDVRGSTITVDPQSGESVAPVDALVRSAGSELGLRWEPNDRFNATIVAFQISLDSELLFVGDAGTTEAVGGSQREGVELNTFWRPVPELVLHANYTRVNSGFDEDSGEGREIPGAIPEAATFGATWSMTDEFVVSMRGRYFRGAPLIESGVVSSDSATLMNLAATYQWENTQVRLEAFNLFDSSDADIAYFYASRLAGEPAAGVEDVHLHPFEPRALRLSVTYSFL